MPTETVLIITAIVGVFAAFAAVLLWADAQTRRHRRERQHPAE